MRDRGAVGRVALAAVDERVPVELVDRRESDSADGATIAHLDA